MKLLAKLISAVGNPLVIGLFFGVYFIFNDKEPETLRNLPLIFAGTVVIPLICFIAVQKYRGVFENLDVSNQRQRNQVYLLVIILFSLLSIFIYRGEYPTKALLLSLILLLFVWISYLINQKIKVSMHVGVSVLFSWIFYPINPFLALLVFLFSIVNAWSRLQLGRHTVREVTLGFLLGNVIGALYIFWFNAVII